MNGIALRVNQLAEEKWGLVVETINEKVRQNEEEYIELDIEGQNEVDEASENKIRKPSHPLQKIYGLIETYMSQVPVLGFNSGKYDLNAIRRCLAKHLHMHEDFRAFVVKKNNEYTCIATESLKFMDMRQFLAVGSSYASFLKAYHVTEQKG